MEQVVIGIDLGGTTTTLGAVTRAGEVRWRQTFDTRTAAGFPAYMEQLRGEIAQVRDRAGADLVGIGVGAPAGNHRYGTVQAANLNWGGVVGFTEALSRHFNLPISLDNDANATALGEMLFGAAQPYRHFILVTLGTGLGSGIVSNGQVVYGYDGLAGELGHICVDMDGRDCACGRKGCLETYVSANGLKRTAFELMARRVTPSVLRDYGYHALTAQRIAEAATAGDSLAHEAFAYTGKLLGLKLADAVAHTSPEAIILFGGLANAGPVLFEPTAQSLKKHMLFLYNPDIPLLPSALPQSDAALLGAAALAWQRVEQGSGGVKALES
jgi:glucokinase